MKTKTTIKEITHDNLVDLFSTAIYGSSWLNALYDVIEYKSLPDSSDDDCFEDALAKMLLAGKTIQIRDMYAEDESCFYGNLPHVWDAVFEEMRYTVSLKDIEKGLSKCFDSAGTESHHLARFAENLANAEGDFDLIQAECVMQVIVFGEEIYG